MGVRRATAEMAETIKAGEALSNLNPSTGLTTKSESQRFVWLATTSRHRASTLYKTP